jgi:hypothetical protein
MILIYHFLMIIMSLTYHYLLFFKKIGQQFGTQTNQQIKFLIVVHAHGQQLFSNQITNKSPKLLLWLWTNIWYFIILQFNFYHSNFSTGICSNIKHALIKWECKYHNL